MALVVLVTSAPIVEALKSWLNQVKLSRWHLPITLFRPKSRRHCPFEAESGMNAVRWANSALSRISFCSIYQLFTARTFSGYPSPHHALA